MLGYIHHLGYMVGYTTLGIYHPVYSRVHHVLTAGLLACTRVHQDARVLREEALGSEEENPLGGGSLSLSGP